MRMRCWIHKYINLQTVRRNNLKLNNEFYFYFRTKTVDIYVFFDKLRIYMALTILLSSIYDK